MNPVHAGKHDIGHVRLGKMKIYEVLDTWRGERLSPQGPYAVGWSAQSHEWYGNEGPETKQGRYKPKGDGGEIVAINVPDLQTAKLIANRLDQSYDSDQFYDKSVYARHGKDWYINQYHGAWIKPMRDVEEYQLKYLPRDVKDYQKGVAEGSDQYLIYISKNKVRDFEQWMESEGLETEVPKKDVGKFIVYDYSGQDVTTKSYADDWNEKPEQGVTEVTGDVEFDKMLKGITAKKAVAKQQKADTQQQARDAFGGMFGGGNPADKLGVGKKKNNGTMDENTDHRAAKIGKRMVELNRLYAQAQRMKDDTLVNKIKQALSRLAAEKLRLQGTAPADMAEGMNDESPVAQALKHRIMHRHLDLLEKYGPEKLLQAIDDVASFVGDVEEIGSSDVSIWVKNVERLLQRDDVSENFQSFRHFLQEGTWAAPQTYKQAMRLRELMSKPLPLSVAQKRLYHLVGDDILFDWLDEMARSAEYSPDHDARYLVALRLEQWMNDLDNSEWSQPWDPRALKIVQDLAANLDKFTGKPRQRRRR